MKFEDAQRVERTQEVGEAMRQEIVRKVDHRLRELIKDKMQAWQNSHMERYSDQLEKEADRIFSMILEGKSSGHAIEEEPTRVAKDLVSGMEFK